MRSGQKDEAVPNRDGLVSAAAVKHRNGGLQADVSAGLGPKVLKGNPDRRRRETSGQDHECCDESGRDVFSLRRLVLRLELWT